LSSSGVHSSVKTFNVTIVAGRRILIGKENFGVSILATDSASYNFNVVLFVAIANILFLGRVKEDITLTVGVPG